VSVVVTDREAVLITLRDPRSSVPVNPVTKLTSSATVPRWLATNTREPSALKARERGWTPTGISATSSPCRPSITDTVPLSRLQTQTRSGFAGSTAREETCACCAVAAATNSTVDARREPRKLDFMVVDRACDVGCGNEAGSLHDNPRKRTLPRSPAQRAG